MINKLEVCARKGSQSDFLHYSRWRTQKWSVTWLATQRSESSTRRTQTTNINSWANLFKVSWRVYVTYTERIWVEMRVSENCKQHRRRRLIGAKTKQKLRRPPGTNLKLKQTVYLKDSNDLGAPGSLPGLRRGSAAVRPLRLRDRIPSKSRMSVVLCVVQVGVSATGWSLVQGCPIECGVCLSTFVEPQQRRDPGPLRAVLPRKKDLIDSMNERLNQSINQSE